MRKLALVSTLTGIAVGVGVVTLAFVYMGMVEERLYGSLYFIQDGVGN